MTPPPRRCAIYTRKSSEEGLEQDFNSLDAQREACEAYIRSQKHEGWIDLPDRYDDGGLSGATLERPALQRLLAAIKRNAIDIVVVYKVDRLTRALADFAKIVEIFDAHGVSFVSVTQAFNTTSSMGRLTLNVLLSFAQFEREVTGERIRDKIAASKKKGMWMGGFVPLGYDAKDRTLVINDAEAATVRTLFQLYRDLGCVRRVQDAAGRLGLTTKTGKPFARGALYTLLQNPIYVGAIRHRGTQYPGQHAAIIDWETWDAVQANLAANRVSRHDGSRATDPSLLAGKLVDDRGQRFTPSHAIKQGRRYRYYVEHRPDAETADGRRPHRTRIAASEIEGLVINRVTDLLRSPAELVAALDQPRLSAAQMARVIEAAANLLARVTAESGDRHAQFRPLVARVVLSAEAVRIDVDRAALQSALDLDTPASAAAPHTLVVSATLRRRGVELKFVIDASARERPPAPDPTLIKVIVRAHDWWHQLRSGAAATLAEIAAAEGVTDRYVRRLLDLAFLAPDILTAILDGRQPIDLTAERLTRLPALPLAWADQRRLLLA